MLYERLRILLYWIVLLRMSPRRPCFVAGGSLYKDYCSIFEQGVDDMIPSCDLFVTL